MQSAQEADLNLGRVEEDRTGDLPTLKVEDRDGVFSDIGAASSGHQHFASMCQSAKPSVGAIEEENYDQPQTDKQFQQIPPSNQQSTSKQQWNRKQYNKTA